MSSNSISSSTLDAIAISAAAVAVVALILAFVAVLRIASIKRSLLVLQGDATHGSLLSAVDRHVGAVDQLRVEVAGVQGEMGRLKSDLADALRHVAVVRYDAFSDMGGRMSFSAALLDDDGDGLVLTAINGRSETRAYAKGIKSGQSDYQLSPEEEQAVSYAQTSRKAGGKGQDRADRADRADKADKARVTKA